jgi:urease accessory protein
MASPLLLLQIADSAFPTGGFAHSGGLEAAYQLGEIGGSAGLSRYLAHSIQAAGHALMPLITAAHAEPSRLAALDRLCDAFTTNHVANRASRAQGKAWLAVAAAAFGGEALRELRARVREEALPGHLAPVFGAVAALLEVSREETQRLFLFLHLRGLVAAAVRLGLVGPLEAQGLQHRLGDVVEAVRMRAGALGEDDLASPAPLLDILQGHHDRLYSRLFSS